MLRFTCPKCHTALEAANPPPGQPVICPQCKSRLHVQTSTAAKKTAPAPAPTPAPAPAFKDVPTESAYDRPRSRKKKATNSNLPLIIGLAVGGGGLVVALLVVLIVILANMGGKETPVVKNTNDPGRRHIGPVPPPDTRTTPRDNPPPRDNAPAANRPSEEEEKPKPPKDNSGASGNIAGNAPTKPPETPASAESEMGTSTVGSVANASDVYNYVLKSAVLILVTDGRTFGNGSGALIDKENRVVLTNHHVVDGADEIAVVFPTYDKSGKLIMSRTTFAKQFREGNLIKAKVLVADAKRDLALIQLGKVPDGVDALPLAKQQTSTGQTVHSVGNPGDSGALWVYTSGTVRAVYPKQWSNRIKGKVVMRDCNIVETQSPTNPGDSGGPLVNDRGEMVGVTHGGSVTANLLSTFIDVTEAKALIDETFRKESLTWKPASRAALVKRSGGGGDVTSLIKDLESTEARTRARAAKILGDMGPEAQIAIPGLLKAVKDNDALTRRTATEALTKIGPPAKADLTALAAALKDNNLEVQRYAAGAVGELGADASAVVPELLELAGTGDALLKQHVLRSLGKAGSGARDKVTPVLSEALKDSDKSVRVAAAEALNSLSTGQSSDLPIFAALLKNQQDAEIRVQGARGLAKLGREAKPALADLLAAGKDSDKMVRKAAIEALIAFGPEARNAVPVYTEALKDSDKDLRKAALQALAKMGAESKNAVPAIRDLLKEPEYRKEALATIGKLGGVAKDAVPAIGDLLKDKDISKDEKLEMMTTLAGMGPDAAKAVPNLILLFEDREISFRRRVAETLAKIGKPAVTPLVGALQDNSLFVRWGACDALAEIGPAARSPQVLNALVYVGSNDRYQEVQDAAKKAWAKVSGK